MVFFVKLIRIISIYLTVFLTMLTLIIQNAVAIVGADSQVSVNSTLISVRIAGLLSNGLLVEASIDNVIPENVSIAFNPEYLSFNTQDSTLLISYNARISGDALIKSATFKENTAAFNEELLKCIQLLIVFATGLIILILEAFFSKIKSGNDFETIKGNKATIDEESLLLLSFRNPEAYRRALDMILKGELKVKKKRFGKIISKIKKFVDFRR